MNTTTVPQTRLNYLKELTSKLLESLPAGEATRVMEGIQVIAENTDYREAAIVSHLEAILHDYGVDV